MGFMYDYTVMIATLGWGCKHNFVHTYAHILTCPADEQGAMEDDEVAATDDDDRSITNTVMTLMMVKKTLLPVMMTTLTMIMIMLVSFFSMFRKMQMPLLSGCQPPCFIWFIRDWLMDWLVYWGEFYPCHRKSGAKSYVGLHSPMVISTRATTVPQQLYTKSADMGGDIPKLLRPSDLSLLSFVAIICRL